MTRSASLTNASPIQDHDYFVKSGSDCVPIVKSGSDFKCLSKIIIDIPPRGTFTPTKDKILPPIDARPKVRLPIERIAVTTAISEE